jgi:Ca-activated chloride channel family protein
MSRLHQLLGALAFADPWWLAALLALPLLAWWHHRHAHDGALTYSRLPAPLRSGGRRASGALRLHLPFYCRLAALALLVVALARPQNGYAWEESLTEGIDIQVVLDVSGSMAAEDFQPDNRLAVAKRVVGNFIAGRTGDRIGLTVFSGSAVTRSPLTTDRRMLDELLDALDINTAMDGTAIGVALANGAARLKDSEAKSRVIVLVTDGVNNSGAIDPDSAAEVCQGLGIKVYTVGVGVAGRVPVPQQFRDASGRVETRRIDMDVEVDEELLESIAERTGGRFFQAVDPGSLRGVFAEIDRLEKTPLEIERSVRYREVFAPFVQAAVALLLLPLALSAAGLTPEP